MFVTLVLKDLVVKNEFNLLNLLERIEKIGKLGIDRLVIAPVYYDKESNSSIEEVKKISEDINTYLLDKEIDLKVYPGNTIRDNFDNIKDYINGAIGSINDSKYVLLDVEEGYDIKELIEIIYEFNLRNTIPIIYGPEKIKAIVEDKKNIAKLTKENCLFQLDLASLNGDYGKKVLKRAKFLKKKGIYNFIGFQDNIKEEYIKKDIKTIGKKGMYILMKNSESKKNEILQ